MRGAIASEAGKRAGRTPAAVIELVRLVATPDVDLFASLVAADIDADVVLQAAATVTGMPVAPRLLLKNPTPPSGLDAVGIRDAGGVPLGSVQGRVWIAFSDPDAARAAVFSDDVVVCLAHAADLRRAEQLFTALYPTVIAGDTLAMPAVTPEAIEQWRRQNAIAGPRTELHVPAPVLTSTTTATTATKKKDDDEDLFDESGGMPKAPRGSGRLVDANSMSGPVDIANDDTVDAARRVVATRSEQAPDVDDGLARSLDPERLRLLRLAQLGRLRRFRFERVLGHGGMATVYLARDADADDRPVAVKVLEPHLRDDAIAVGRFRRELRTLTSLKHPRIVTPLDGDVEADGGVLWLSCRYLDGGTLHELMERVGAVPVAAALPIVGALLEALAHAHAAGVVHRDLKPHNVLLDHDGSLCLADFGVARAIGDAPLTKAGARFGTPAFMAPEQAAGGVVDQRSDLFSLGVLFYQLVSGTNPFLRGSAAETMAAVARAEVPPLPPVVRLPAAASLLLEALLARASDARPPDAHSALRALAPTLARLPAVDVVVTRLLADPRAFAGVGVVDVDVDDSTIAEPVGRSDDDHSAFGMVLGQKATYEMPLSAFPGLLTASLADTTAVLGPDDADRTDEGLVDAADDHDDDLAADDDDDDLDGGGRGVAAIIGFAIFGLLGLIGLVIWSVLQKS